ncbi:MAG: TorF family putative porin [Pseudomonadota bacterium]
MGKLISRGLALAMVAGAFTAPAAIAEGEFSGNVALTTDYVWRGVSQNGEQPAVQGGFDYANGNFYAGTWASIVDFGGANMELDLYGGWAGETEAGLGWDVGVIGYIYPDTDDLDFVELYGGLSYGFEAVSVSGYLYVDPDNETTYLETSAGFSATDNLGFDATAASYLDGAGEYSAFSLGATFSTEAVDFDLRFWGTDIDDVDEAEERVVLTVSRSL